MYIQNPKFFSLVGAALETKPFGGAFLSGPAGTGKSYLPQYLAGKNNAKIFFFQCFPGTREEDLLTKILPSDRTKSGVKLIDGVILQAVKAAKASNLAYLILDEWDKTRPSADSFLLDFLQSGRVNYNGKSIQLAENEKDNLKIFITMNDERELSEPLLRRLPKIDFQHLTPGLVKQALELTHLNHPHLSNAVILYQRCLQAGLSKPATIQELRQLLDAISLLGDNADWDSLVYQFVTKTKENHLLLQQSEEQEINYYDSELEKPSLNPEAYETQDIQDEMIPVETRPQMPRLKEILKINENITSKEVSTEKEINDMLSNAKGIVTLNDNTYNNIARNCDIDKNKIGDTIEVVNDSIVFKKEISLPEIYNYKSLWSEGGEIVIKHDLTIGQLKILLNFNNKIKVVKVDESEILLKHNTFEARFSNKLEIIANLSCSFSDFCHSINLEAQRFGIYDSSYDYLKKEEIKEIKEIKKPILGNLSKLSKIETFEKISSYLLDLHEYFFGSRSGARGYYLQEEPSQFDLSAWQIRKIQLWRVKLYYKIVIMLMGEYDFISYNDAYGDERLILEKNNSGIQFIGFGYHNNSGYRHKSLEGFYAYVSESYLKTCEYIKILTEVK